MNWYNQIKLAEEEFRWNRFLQVAGLTAVLGLASIWHMGLMDVKQVFKESPQTVIQGVQKIKKQENTVNPYPTQKIQQEIPIEEQDNFLQTTRNMIAQHEGKENFVYKDTEGISTIGRGFNLSRPDAKEKIQSLGLNFNDILNKRVGLTDKQIEQLFKYTYNEALGVANSFLPNFETYPNTIKQVIIDMAFNMGPNKLNQFKKFRQALIRRDFQKAADEMIDSQWYNQVGNRSKELVQMMRGVK